MSGRLACATVLLLTVASLDAGEGKKPSLPDFRIVTTVGCAIDYQGGLHISPGWRLILWVDYLNRPLPKGEKHHWSFFYSQRESLKKAAKDCEKWMKFSRKEMKRVRKGAEE